MRRSLLTWLLRGLAVIVLTVIIALAVLVKPIPETPPPTLTPTPTPTPTSPPTWTPTPTPSPTPTPTPTLTPAPTPTPSPTPPPEPEVVEVPLPVPTVTLAGRLEQHTYASQIAGQDEPYAIYLPPGYDQGEQRYPVLYLFHGWPYEAADWNELGADEFADLGIQEGALPPFIIVMPRGREALFVYTAGGDLSFEGQVVAELIPHVDATYRTWGNREGRAVGGISRGGVWSLEIAFRHTDLFSAVGAHSPALKHNRAPTPYDPFYLLQNPAVADLRIYLDAGSSDWALQHTQMLREALDERSIFNQFVIHEGSHTKGTWAGNMVEYLAFYTAGWR